MIMPLAIARCGQCLIKIAMVDGSQSPPTWCSKRDLLPHTLAVLSEPVVLVDAGDVGWLEYVVLAAVWQQAGHELDG